MASFDAERGCYVVRVVYDGPGMAGKTTNLQKICEIVPADSAERDGDAGRSSRAERCSSTGSKWTARAARPRR